MNKHLKNGLAELGDVGSGTLGIGAGHLASNYLIKKNTLPVNGAMIAVGVLGRTFIPKPKENDKKAAKILKKAARTAMLGWSLFYGVKAINNLTNTDATAGLGVVLPEKVRALMAKVIPKLGDADDSFMGLNEAEQQLLLGEAEEMGRAMRAAGGNFPFPGPASSPGFRNPMMARKTGTAASLI